MANPVFLTEEAINEKFETYVVTDAVDGGVSVKINGETVTMFADLLAKCQTGRAVLYGQATTVETGYAFYTAASVTDSVIQFQVSGMLYDKSNIRYGMYVRRIKIVPRANGGLLVDDSGLEGPFASKDYVGSDDFATDLLGKPVAKEAIDERLPIPISAKSAGFTTESYKRFVVTVSGDMTVTLHTPTSGDAEIFECRFNGTSLSADASITFAGATATTMDANCGTVKAGKVALMSAFWNGTTWDVNWKVEG